MRSLAATHWALSCCFCAGATGLILGTPFTKLEHIIVCGWFQEITRDQSPGRKEHTHTYIYIISNKNKHGQRERACLMSSIGNKTHILVLDSSKVLLGPRWPNASGSFLFSPELSFWIHYINIIQSLDEFCWETLYSRVVSPRFSGLKTASFTSEKPRDSGDGWLQRLEDPAVCIKWTRWVSPRLEQKEIFRYYQATRI